MDEITPDFSQQQTFTLTNTLLSKLPPVLAEALKLAAIPYWFDEPLLAALRGPADADGRTHKIFERLIGFSFVSPVGEGRYTVTHDLRMLLRTHWSADRAGFAEANERAAKHFSARLAEARGPAVEEFEQARLYHLLGADSETGIAALRQVFETLQDVPRRAVLERLVVIAEEQRLFFSPAHTVWLDYFQARLHQLYGRWDQACAALEAILRQGDSPTLRACALRALAESLAHAEQWAQAIQLYQQALIIFEQQNDPAAALVMLDLGQAFVDMAVNVWGQRELQPHLRYATSQRLLDVADVPARLPILAYLALELGPGVLRSTLTLARGVDWMIARLFVSGARWYRRSQQRLQAVRPVVGLPRLQERLARLYHALGHFSGAAQVYRQLLAQSDPPPGEYRRARAQLGLAHVLSEQGQWAASVPLLEQALPTMRAYEDVGRQAQAHSLLGRACANLRRADDALEHYRHALALYRQSDDVVGQTNVAHQLKEWASFSDTPAPTRKRALEQAASVELCRYLARYVHPALVAFRAVGIGAMAVVLFCAIFLSIRVETGAEVWTSSTVSASALAAPSSTQTARIAPASWQTVHLRIVPNVAIGGVLLTLSLYMLLYTALGIYLISQTSLYALQEGQAHDLSVDEQGLFCGRRTVLWSDVTGIVNIDRKLGRQPLAAISQTVVMSINERIEINGSTGWYPALTAEIMRRAPDAPRYNFGFSVIFGWAGLVLAASLAGLAAIAALALLQPVWLTIGAMFYTVADLRLVSYVGMLISLMWWLVIAPLRAEIFLRPRSVWPWIVLGAGIALTLLAGLMLGVLRVWLGLPGVLPVAFAASLMWIGLGAIWTGARQTREPPLAVRLAALLLVMVLTAVAAVGVGREVSAQHALRQGDAAAVRARQTEPDSAAAAEYRAALQAYTRAIELNPSDAAAYAGRGIVHGQMGLLEEALSDYNRSLQLDPRQPALLAARATLYETIATRARLNGDEAGMQAAYQQAIADLTASIELDGETARYYVQRGVLYLALNQREAALADFQAAQQLSPNDPDVLNGLGWIDYQLGSQARLTGDAVTAEQALKQAAQAFERAIQLDKHNLNNYSGLGWACRELGLLERQRNNWDKALEYYRQVEKAFAYASQQAPDNPLYRLSWGHAMWLVSTYYNSCGATRPVSEAERKAYMEMIDKAITEIGQGVALARRLPALLDQSLAAYYAEQGQLSYILYTCKGDDRLLRLQQTIGYYSDAIAEEPDNAEYYHRRGRFTYVLAAKEEPDLLQQALTFERAVADLEKATVLASSNEGYKTWLGYAASAGAASYFKLGLQQLADYQNRDAAYQYYLSGVTLAQKLDISARQTVLAPAIAELEKLAPSHGILSNDIRALIEMLKAAGK